MKRLLIAAGFAAAFGLGWAACDAAKEARPSGGGLPETLTVSEPACPANGHRPRVTKMRVYRVVDESGAVDVGPADEDVAPWRVAVEFGGRSHSLYCQPE